MVWYRKPGFNRFHGGRIVREAAWLNEMPVSAPTFPGSEEDTEWFMSSFTLTPIYETGSGTVDTFVGAVYIDSATDLVARAYLGSTKPGTAVTVKVSTSYVTPGSTATGVVNITNSSALADTRQTEAAAFSAAQGYLFFYLSCASAECSWQCPAIVLTVA